MDGKKLMQDLLKDFGATIGASDLAPDEDGYACLSIDDSFVVHLIFEEESEALRFFAELCEAPSIHENIVMRELLDANVLWRGSNGATLGLDSGKKVITLAYQEPISVLSSTRFEQILEAFIVTGEHWISRISGIANDTAEKPTFDDMRQGLRV